MPFLDQFFKTLELIIRSYIEPKMELNLEKLRRPLHVLTLTLLSLLLPLSFLLLARLSYASFLSTLFPKNLISHQISSLFSLFFHPNNYPIPLHAAVAALTIAALLHSLTSKIVVTSEASPPSLPLTHKPRLCVAWALLCALQVFVGLGIEGSISSGITQPHFDAERRSMLSKIIFFLGMHEAMLYWCRAVVKPVVDDTIFERAVEERWTERMFMAAAYGGLWWWRMRDEVEALAIVAKVKKEMAIGVGMVDFVNWWLYYLIETIGRVWIVKRIVWVGMVLLWRRGEKPKSCGAASSSPKDDNMV